MSRADIEITPAFCLELLLALISGKAHSIAKLFSEYMSDNQLIMDREELQILIDNNCFGEDIREV